MNKIYIIIIVAFLMHSCAPDRFIIQRAGDFVIDGFIMKNIDSVEIKNDYSFILSSGSMVSLRSVPTTEADFDMTIDLLEGDGAEFYFRTAVDKFDLHPFIKLNLTTSSSSVFENKMLVQEIDSVKLQKQSGKLHIRNNGNKYLITYNCDTVKYGTTPIENSEFLIIKPTSGSKIKIRNFYINQEDDIEEFYQDKKYIKK